MQFDFLPLFYQDLTPLIECYKFLIGISFIFIALYINNIIRKRKISKIMRGLISRGIVSALLCGLGFCFKAIFHNYDEFNSLLLFYDLLLLAINLEIMRYGIFNKKFLSLSLSKDEILVALTETNIVKDRIQKELGTVTLHNQILNDLLLEKNIKDEINKFQKKEQ